MPHLPPPRRLLPRALVPAAAALWLVLVAGGVVLIERYTVTPGALDGAPSSWPSDSALPSVPGHYTLVMFLHPKCVCSHASLTELAEVMKRSAGRAVADVVFLRPAGVDSTWEKTDSWEQAGQLTHTTRIVDDAGREADRFHAATSGELLVYDPAGRLRYAGGITGARGHVGDNLGEEQVLAALNGAPAAEQGAGQAVFGCALRASKVRTTLVGTP